MDTRYLIAHGPCILYPCCLLLLLRGANTAFRREALEGAELSGWAGGRSYEQYLGLLTVLK